MNWFERYGIVGGYFLMVSVGWLYAVLDITKHIELGNAIVGAATVLPFGYLVCIFSQFLYYIGFGGRQIHNEIGEIIKQNKIYQDQIKLDDCFGEETNEAVITFYDRMILFSHEKVEEFKFLAQFITKRFDVLSINNGIILAAFLAPMFIVCLLLFLFNLKLNSSLSYNIKPVSVILMITFSLLSILITKGVNNKFNKQIILINKEIFYSRYFKTKFEAKNILMKILRYVLGGIASVIFFLIIFHILINIVNYYKLLLFLIGQ